jgi:predicted permease
MTDLLADVRYGARTFVKRPGFAVVAVLLLALGIGATTTIFSWVEGFVLRPLPGVSDASSLVMVNGTTKTRRDISLSYPNFADLLRLKPASIATMTAARMVAVNVRANRDPERAWAELVTGEFFDVLGVGPSVGRVLSRDDDRQPGGHPVVVVSHAFWQQQLAGDAQVVGRTMAVNGKPFTIIGVAAEGFRGGGAGLRIDLWVPMMMQRTVTSGDRLVERGNAWLQVLARLAPGATLEEAQAGLSAAAAQLIRDYPVVNSDRGVALSPLWKAPNTASSILGPVLAVLFVVVGLVLLIVCANLASLMLARAAGRQREIAVRLALGASRLRIVRQLLTESLLLSVAGAALGLLFAVWGSQMFSAFIPPTPQPITGELSLTARVPLLGMTLVIVTTVLFGLLPALQATRTTLVPALKDTRGSIGGRRRTRVRSGLVVAQVALSMVLLVGAGLFARTLQQSQHADVGFDLEQGVLASIDVLPAGYDAARGTQFYRDLLAEVRAIPGVQGAGLARDIPLKLGAGSDTSGDIEGYASSKDEEIVLYYDRVSPGFLSTLGAPLLEGRQFDETDDLDHPKVVVINQTMARRYWKNRSAVGGRIHLGEWYTVVGVVGDLKYSTLNAPPVSFVYLPLYASYRPDVTLLVRTAGAPSALIPGIRAAVARLNPDLPLFDVRTMEEHRHQVTFIAAIAASLLGAFGGVALLLATVGLYGLLGFVVSQRTSEIGLRVALGAQRADIRRLIGGHGLRLTVVGTALGLGLALLLMPLMSSQLVGVSATDGVTYVVAAFVLLVGASGASYLPARRAARVDPLTALRDE